MTSKSIRLIDILASAMVSLSQSDFLNFCLLLLKFNKKNERDLYCRFVSLVAWRIISISILVTNLRNWVLDHVLQPRRALLYKILREGYWVGGIPGHISRKAYNDTSLC